LVLNFGNDTATRWKEFHMGMEWDPEGKYSDIDRRHVAISMQEKAF
jgi:hypothetical protein